MASPAAECIGRMEQTQGTETSQYLEEKKSTETPSVAASEGGYSPNRARNQGIVDGQLPIDDCAERNSVLATGHRQLGIGNVLVSSSGLRALEELQRRR